uniref:Uncharacterized protein n=1 Tax=Thermogemmatispora argillosa TaxID=2045280 RepID=A0A455T427_9CHLR|nr:hypothetical protein KTA_35620 [Thermogemmatispora argillosa]
MHVFRRSQVVSSAARVRLCVRCGRVLRPGVGRCGFCGRAVAVSWGKVRSGEVGRSPLWRRGRPSRPGGRAVSGGEAALSVGGPEVARRRGLAELPTRPLLRVERVRSGAAVGEGLAGQRRARAEARRARLALVTTLPLRQVGAVGGSPTPPSFPSLASWPRGRSRAERGLWFGGTAVLLGLVMALAWGMLLGPGWPLTVSRAWLPAGRATAPAHGMAAPTLTPASGLRLWLLAGDGEPLRPGMRLRVAGSGFSAFAPVRFWLDGRLPFVDERGWPLLVEADGAGAFTATLRLAPQWPPGRHFVLARDLQTGQGTWLALRLGPASAPTPIARPWPSSGPAAGP